MRTSSICRDWENPDLPDSFQLISGRGRYLKNKAGQMLTGYCFCKHGFFYGQIPSVVYDEATLSMAYTKAAVRISLMRLSCFQV